MLEFFLSKFFILLIFEAFEGIERIGGTEVWIAYLIDHVLANSIHGVRNLCLQFSEIVIDGLLQHTALWLD
jgi:hypothetical protein